MELEDLHRVVVQGFASLNDKIDSVETRLSGRIDSLQDEMNDRFGRVDQDLALVKEAVMEHGRQLKDVRATLDKKVDRDEVEAIVERVVGRGAGH